jgi:hypothetical protein
MQFIHESMYRESRKMHSNSRVSTAFDCLEKCSKIAKTGFTARVKLGFTLYWPRI